MDAMVTDWLDVIDGTEGFEAEHFVDEAEMHQYLSGLEVEFQAHHRDELADD